MSEQTIPTTGSLFNLAKSERLKEEGITLGASNKSDLVRLARREAVHLCKTGADHRVTIDMVMIRLRNKFGIDTLGMAAGSVFRDKRFLPTGEWRKSPRITNHARPNRVWQLNPHVTLDADNEISK